MKGYLFALESRHNQFVRRKQLRTRIVSITDAAIVNVLLAHVKIDSIIYSHLPNGDILVTDGTDWHLDITHL